MRAGARRARNRIGEARRQGAEMACSGGHPQSIVAKRIDILLDFVGGAVQSSESFYAVRAQPALTVPEGPCV